MADTKVSGLTSMAATPASNDLLIIVDVSDTTQASSGTTKKITSAYFAVTNGNVATISGGGTISLGGYTLTVPATGTPALIGTAQTFTTNQAIAPTTDVVSLQLNMPSGATADAMQIKLNGTTRMQFKATSAISEFVLNAFDNGSSYGPFFQIGRNSNASTPAAGFLYTENRAGTAYYQWVDASGNLRIGTSLPTNANDGTGTVVGTQTSMAAAKNISEGLPDLVESLKHIVAAAKTLRGYSYKADSYNGEYFPVGIITDYAPRYGMDRDAEHPHGKSLNVPVAIGDLIASVALLAEKLGYATNDTI